MDATCRERPTTRREAEKKQTDQAVGDLGQLKDKCRDGL
jgi:hypothetical protein